MNHNFTDLTGQRFGRLLVIKRVENDKNGNLRWLCRCGCGKEKVITGGDLKRGHTKSCGCLQKEIVKINETTHGKSKSHTYRVWTNMIERCMNPNHVSYKYYGGRDKPITVCERWSNKKTGFQNFLKDIGEIPEGKELDRIDNDGNYLPTNYRLITHKENCSNRSNNRIIPFNGKFWCLTNLAKEYKISIETLRCRLKRGLSTEEALTMPVRKRKT